MAVMSGGIYGGDEVGAVVFDIGHHSLRIGYAGEEAPKSELPSTVGVLSTDDDDSSVTNINSSISVSDTLGGDNNSNEALTKSTQPCGAANNSNNIKKKYYIGTTALHVARSGVEAATFLSPTGVIERWDVFERVLDHAYSRCLQTRSEHHPVLMSEPPLNQRSAREQLTELLFEKYNVPAFFLVKNAVLAAFANGRSTALVLDSGATHTTAVPVQDGYALTQNVVRSPLGGDFIAQQCRQYLSRQDIDVVPAYMVAAKEAVKDGEPARWTRKASLPPVTQSWHDYMVGQVVRDFQASVLQCVDDCTDENIAQMPTGHYEFPNGYHQDIGEQRFHIPECLFDPSQIKGVDSTMLGISNVAHNAVTMCDVDLRPGLYGNVVVTGGNSLLPGLPERLNRELSRRTPPNIRLKLVAAPGSVERRFGSWIGGSILGSLGSFQQMWISRQEYDESGRSLVDKKCP